MPGPAEGDRKSGCLKDQDAPRELFQIVRLRVRICGQRHPVPGIKLTTQAINSRASAGVGCIPLGGLRGNTFKLCRDTVL